MHRVTKRTWLVAVFLLMLLGGLGLFLTEYITDSGTWVTTSGSPHLYSTGNLGCGTVVDCSGVTLLQMGDERTYADDTETRMSTVHWLGDREGNIQASAVANYAAQMAGFDLVNGVYNTDDTEGVMTLTLSADVQNTALEQMAGRKGTICVYNYKTGEIYCALTTPTFDPDDPPTSEEASSDENEGLYLNRFLQSVYIPGSTFKVVTTIAALETVPDILEQTFTCTGSYSYGTEEVTCEYAHGTLTLSGALAHSCNCAFAQISKLIGRENMTQIVEQLQVTEPLSFDGVTTASGNYDNSNTGGASFAWSCIGQHTDQINPARYMTFMGAIASGGFAAQPYIVQTVTVGSETTYEAETTSTDRILDATTAQTVKEYMRNNVQTVYGDGNFPGLEVCAKSGTSQLGGGKTSNALFTGFVQNEEYPLAFFIVVENGGYGSSTCVPIMSEVLNACRRLLDGE